jgi:hypothetical protein
MKRPPSGGFFYLRVGSAATKRRESARSIVSRCAGAFALIET